MPGSLTDASVRASRSIRRRRDASCAAGPARSFTATSRLRRRSRPRQTSAMPPTPMRSDSSYRSARTRAGCVVFVTSSPSICKLLYPQRGYACTRSKRGYAAAEEQELSIVDQHPADLATDTVEREQHVSVIEMAEASLRDVEGAEQRLEQGKYGICEADGRPIPDERLRALPETPFCVEHAAEQV